MKIYLCGRMSGLPDGGFAAFRNAADDLRSRGHEVVSPVEMNEQAGESTAVAVGHSRRAEFMARDIAIVVDPSIDALAVLPGWEASSGFADERAVARMIDKPVLAYPTLEPLAESVLVEAERLVSGDRGTVYGHPAEDFERTAGMWGAAFGWDVDAVRVALAMVLLKTARLASTRDHRDSLTDVAGYARTAEAVLAREGVAGFLDIDDAPA